MIKPIGPEANFKLEGANGKLRVSVSYSGKDMDAGLFAEITPDQLVDALAALIPGDSAVEVGALAALKLGLKAAIGG